MNLKILLPYEIFVHQRNVTKIVAETHNGFFGLLPLRQDCAAALSPGILIYESREGGEIFVGVDEGVLIKTGPDVFVSVRNAIIGSDLTQLKEAVELEFLNKDEREKNIGSVMMKMENGLMTRLMEFHRE